MKMRNLIATATFCCAAAVLAREVSGVSMPEVAHVADKDLRLNGMGVRKEKALFKVYVVALYLEQPTADPLVAITADEGKRIVLTMLRDISREQFVQAVETSITRNSGAVMPTLRARLDLLENALPAPQKGDVLSFTYLPGLGTLMSAPGQEMTIPGKDFADALLSAWLGPKPASETLKRQLLAVAAPTEHSQRGDDQATR
jgi:hypothetical protein